MAKNWSDLKLELSSPSHTVDEAVKRLLLVLSDADKLAIAAMAEDDLYDLHFTLGLTIRNAWLHKPESQLLASCGTSHPDDASSTIIGALWRALQS